MTKTTKRYDQPGEYSVKIVCDKAGVEREWRGSVRAERAGEYKLRVVVEHEENNVKSRVVVRAVASNGARVELLGMIRVRKLVQGVDSFLELRVLLLDESSTAIVDPQLEIEANAVRVGHAASVSRIDSGQVQYLMSRGLTKKLAEEKIAEGWLVIE